MISRWTISLKAICYYWRTHGAVFLGMALATAVLTGALLVGDSVRHSLARIADARIRGVDVAVQGGDRFLRAQLAESMPPGVTAAPVIVVEGAAVEPESRRRANHVQVLGVDRRFWSLGNAGEVAEGWMDSSDAAVNDHLAARLAVEAGDTIVLRVRKPSGLPSDAPFASDQDLSTAIRVRVGQVVDDESFGRFSLRVNQTPPENVYLPLVSLQRALEQEARANLLLFRGASTSEVQQIVRDRWTLADAEAELIPLPDLDQAMLRSRRVFIGEALEAAAIALPHAPFPVVGYFANSLRHQDQETPYSIVAAVPFDSGSPWTALSDAPMMDDDIVINDWLARDLSVAPGDFVDLAYYVMGPMRALVETQQTFQVAAVVPIEGLSADADLMPDIPGVSDSENCSDWDPGFPLDLERIRDEDEAYWDKYRGTPKAFIRYSRGRELWENRFGSVTGFRFPMPEQPLEVLARDLAANLDPFTMGFELIPVRERALAGSREGLNFGVLFVSFSFFLIASALLLAAMLFRFCIEQRAREIGLLRAIGHTTAGVNQVFRREGLLIAAAGVLAGAPCGVLYTRLMVRGLATIWRDVVIGAPIQFHAGWPSLLSGAAAGFAVAWGVLALSGRRLARLPPAGLLRGETGLDAGGSGRRHPFPLVLAAVCTLAAVGLAAGALRGDAAGRAAAFFGVGGMLLVAGSAICFSLLSPGLGMPGPSLSRWGLVARGVRRRRGRSVATIILLACGCFIVVAVVAHRLDASVGAEQPTAGTGGFAFVAETTQPILRDLNDSEALTTYGIETNRFTETRVVPFRVREGDDASCLNLNRAQTPRLLSVDSTRLDGRFTFAATLGSDAGEDPWSALRQELPDGVVPAIADQNSILWALRKKLGDTLAYQNEQGDVMHVKLVGGLANSILQGSIVVDEQRFLEHFPSHTGYHLFLIDAGTAQRESVAEELRFAFDDAGIEVTDAAQRLAAFNTIQNTYLAMFQVLGALGVLVGSIGLGVVVFRNVLDRRREFGIQRALGYSLRRVVGMVVAEHTSLLTAGLAVGIGAAMVALLPSLLSPGETTPFRLIAWTAAGVFLNGLVWTLFAVRAASRGDFLDALREE